MFSTSITVDLQKKDELINLEFLSDLHVGHAGFREDLLRKRIKAIVKDPTRYTAFLGDNIDAIGHMDKRWQQNMINILSIDDQRKKWQEIIDPLVEVHIENLSKNKTPKILYGQAGNHEYKAMDQSYIINQFYEPNLITYLGSRGFVGIEARYKGETLHRWSILSIHGAGGGTNPLAALDHMMSRHNADVYVMGHLHDKVIKPVQVAEFNFNKNKWDLRDVILANTGSFCDTYVDGVDGYMDRKNKVGPNKPGTITITFDAFNHQMHEHE